MLDLKPGPGEYAVVHSPACSTSHWRFGYHGARHFPNIQAEVGRGRSFRTVVFDPEAQTEGRSRLGAKVLCGGRGSTELTEVRRRRLCFLFAGG